jgi:putative ABC transport system substrate-binding protein
MHRRSVLSLLGTSAAASAWPLAARAQQPAMAVIGFLHPSAPGIYSLNGLRQGLKEAGFVEGQNLAIEYRWANNQLDRLPELVADLLRRRVQVIVTLTSAPAAFAAKAATSTIPIVFGFGSDPTHTISIS